MTLTLRRFQVPVASVIVEATGPEAPHNPITRQTNPSTPTRSIPTSSASYIRSHLFTEPQRHALVQEVEAIILLAEMGMQLWILTK